MTLIKLRIQGRILDDCRVDVNLADEANVAAESTIWWDSSGYQPVKGSRVLKAAEVEQIVRAMDGIRIGPPSDNAAVLDGQAMELVIEGGVSESAFRWIASAPSGWLGLEELARLLVDLVGFPPEVKGLLEDIQGP